MKNAPSELSKLRRKRTIWKRNTLFKLRHVFVPLALLSVGFLISYTALHGWMDRSMVIPLLDDDLVTFWIPFIFSGILVSVWLKPRVKLLKWKSDNTLTLGCFLAGLCLAVPTIIAQIHLDESLGSVTHLESIEQIESYPPTKYYAIRDLVFDKSQSRYSVRTWSGGGRVPKDWHMNVYFTVPLSQERATESTVWLGIIYSQIIDNHLSHEVKRAKLNEYIGQLREHFYKDDFHWVSYFQRLGNNKDRKGLEATFLNGSRFKRSVPDTILIAHSKDFESRIRTERKWVFATLGIGLGIWLLLVILIKINLAESRKWKRGERPGIQELREEWEEFIPGKELLIMPILLILNTLVWGVMFLAGDGMDTTAFELLAWGGVHGANVQDGEFWRFFTSLFVHADFLHWGNNMILLWLLGLLVEKTFGRWWFLGVYLVSGIVAAFITLLWSPDVVLVGASGCLFGVVGFGLVSVLVSKKQSGFEKRFVLKVAGVFLVLNLLFGLLVPAVSLVAHIAGLGCGALFGLLTLLDSKEELPYQK